MRFAYPHGDNRTMPLWKRSADSGQSASLKKYLAFVESTVDSLRHLVIAPRESRAMQFSQELAQIEEEAKAADAEDRCLKAAKRMNDSAQSFAKDQRDAIEGVIADLDHSLRDLVGSLDDALASGDKIAQGAKGVSGRLGSMESLTSFEELRRAVSEEVRILSEAVVEYNASTRSIHEKYRTELESMREHLESAQMAARVDSLTKLPNRTSHEYRLSETVEHAKKGQTASLAILDLDGFKPINDTYGHQAGDAALVEFTQMLYRHLGKECFLARIGGDEFTVIAKQPAAWLEKRLSDLLITLANTPLNVGPATATLGFSYGTAEITADSSYKSAMQEADERMYEFKRTAKRSLAA